MAQHIIKFEFRILHSKYFLSLLLVGYSSPCFLLVKQAPTHIHDGGG
jgi:hypothetical protein